MDPKALRARLGLSQKELARLVGSHAMTVSKWERGLLSPSEHQRGLLEAFSRAVDADPGFASRTRGRDPVGLLAELLRRSTARPELNLGALSATNGFPGTIVELARGEVMCKVVIEVAPEVRIGAVITTDSVDRLELEIGSEAVAIIKATEVIVGRP